MYSRALATLLLRLTAAVAAEQGCRRKRTFEEGHGQHALPRPAGQTVVISGFGGKVSNLAQGRALKGISELSPILAADLRDLPPHPPLEAAHRLSKTARRTGWEAVTGLTFPFARHSSGRGVALGPAKPRRRLSRTSARNGPPLCGCPIHAPSSEVGLSWDAYGRCSCGLSSVETLEPRFGPLACPLGPT